jgi:hypothetical protein
MLRGEPDSKEIHNSEETLMTREAHTQCWRVKIILVWKFKSVNIEQQNTVCTAGSSRASHQCCLSFRSTGEGVMEMNVGFGFSTDGGFADTHIVQSRGAHARTPGPFSADSASAHPNTALCAP